MSFSKSHDRYVHGSTVKPACGPSEGMHQRKIDRKGQSILTATALDNERHTIGIRTSIDDENFRGSGENLSHSYEDD